MNIKRVTEKIEECKKWPNRGFDCKQLTVLKYILDGFVEKDDYASDFLPFPEVTDLATERAFNAGVLIGIKLRGEIK
jgi:hypothetical protein